MDTKLQALDEQIKRRWGVPDFRSVWSWVRPAHVRVLLYAEGAQFDGGSFHGLKHVIATLNASPWFWVRFDVTTASRGADPSAMLQNKTLDQLKLSAKFDEIWLFGVSSGNLLSAAELAAVTDFMNHGGGVLVTGDHASLGQGIAGALPRAGKMRQYPAPPASPPAWNTTLVRGHDGVFDFYDQSDDQPQTVRLRRYPLWDSLPRPFSRRWAPHPIFCGIDGPITVLPDHQHEGEAVVPASFPAGEWPSKGGHQPRPEVIAWGRIKDPAATKVGQEIGVTAAYDGHRADVGRIAADATWHHFFDINLLGDPSVDPVNDNGFVATAAGQAALKQIENYDLNLAVWLAAPKAQAAMRDALWWGGIWTNQFLEIANVIDSIPVLVLGEQATDVFGRIATRCNRREWFFWQVLDPALRLRLEHQLAEGLPLPEHFEQFVMGRVVGQLIGQYGFGGKRVQAGAAPKPGSADKLMREAAVMGIKDMESHYAGLQRGMAELQAVRRKT